MRILALADTESRYYYDFYSPGKLAGVDVILACGDLRREYLEFLVTMANVPLLYVPGNHDDGFVSQPPEGCVCIDDRVVTVGGVRFFGLGGACRYCEGEYVYTEKEMARRIRRAGPAIRRAGGFDVLATHAPARGLGDLDDLSHRGFACFRELLDKYRPRYFVHGHIHRNYGMNVPRLMTCGDTAVINAWEHYMFEY